MVGSRDFPDKIITLDIEKREFNLSLYALNRKKNNDNDNKAHKYYLGITCRTQVCV